MPAYWRWRPPLFLSSDWSGDRPAHKKDTEREARDNADELESLEKVQEPEVGTALSGKCCSWIFSLFSFSSSGAKGFFSLRFQHWCFSSSFFNYDAIIDGWIQLTFDSPSRNTFYVWSQSRCAALLALLLALLGLVIVLHYAAGRRTLTTGVGCGALALCFVSFTLLVERKFFNQRWLAVMSYFILLKMLIIQVRSINIPFHLGLSSPPSVRDALLWRRCLFGVN